MKLAILSSFLCCFVATILAKKERDADKCVACYGLAKHVAKRIQDTEGRAGEQIAIGMRIGADGENRPKTVITYGNSYCSVLCC